MSDDTSSAQAFAKLLAVVTELRARCPWDREQKLADTPRHLIEEAYEVADAIARGNFPDVAEELGDVMVQSLFAGVILAEQSKLDIATGLQNAAEKLIRRHPHIYGDTRADTCRASARKLGADQTAGTRAQGAQRREESRARRPRAAVNDARRETRREGAPRRHGLGQYSRGAGEGSRRNRRRSSMRSIAATPPAPPRRSAT